jgi:hypothetical protein
LEVQQAVAAGIPTGPFAFLDTKVLKLEINRAMEERASKGNGICTVRIAKTLPATPTLAGKGTVCKLECTEAKTHKCSFSLYYEFAHEGFQYYRGTLAHTGHELAKSVPTAMALPGGRTIPPDYEELGSLLAESGFSAHDILRYG